EKFSSRAERHRDTFVLLEIETRDAQLRVQLYHHARAASGHEVRFAFVVLQPGLDLLRALHRITRRIVEAGKIECPLKAPARRVRVPQRLLDLRPDLCGMLRETAHLFADLQALRPPLSLEQHLCEHAAES